MAEPRPRNFPHVRQVSQALVNVYGRPMLGNKGNPFDEILFIILSSKTPPHRYKVTYHDLKKRYPRAEQLAHANPNSIARTIQIGGLAQKKARQISDIAKILKREFGSVTLKPLSRLSNKDAETFLDRLPGIGKKMARCVLMYSLDRAVFPVDAHCFRICQRLGWVSATGTLTDRVADDLQNGVPPDLRFTLHVGMIMLGREYCQPKKMRCSECPLLIYCPTGIKQNSV